MARRRSTARAQLGASVSLLLVALAWAIEECPNPQPKLSSCAGPKSAREYYTYLDGLPTKYDKMQRPPCTNGSHFGPTVVEVQLRLTQLNRVDPRTGTVVVNGYLRSWWNDPRLKFKGLDDGGCTDELRTPGSQEEKLWVPDLFIDNLVTQNTDGMASLTMIRYNGDVHQSQQVLLTVKMNFDLGKLPYDEQLSKVVVSSYSQNSKNMKVLARGGTHGQESTGVGLIAPSIQSSVWEFTQPHDANGGFKTSGRAYTFMDWDYVSLWWTFRREPRFMTMQVVVPCMLFTICSYIQFYVDPAAAPARAFLAVTPVLIMRVLFGTVYKSIPETSQVMWLDSFVTTSMIFCVAAAAHFGVVQYLRLLEKDQTKKRSGLVSAKGVATKLLDIARKEKIPLLQLLTKFAPEERDLTDEEYEMICNASKAEHAAMAEADDPGAPATEVRIAKERCLFRSKIAEAAEVTEAELLFIMYARDVFQKFDKDESGQCSPKEIQRMLTFFGIFMSQEEVVKVVCMFMRDTGHPTPLQEETVDLTFSQITFFLMQVESYILRKDYTFKMMMSWRGLRGYFASMPPSERWDVTARWLWPVLVVLQLIIFYAALPSFGKADTLSSM